MNLLRYNLSTQSRFSHVIRIFKRLTISTLVLASLWAAVLPVSAQDANPLLLRLNRDFGYSSGTGKIQGTFSMRVSGPDNLSRVEFQVDGITIGDATTAPFNLRFETGQFALGVHTMSAIGYTSDGQELQSNELTAEFVPASAATETIKKIVVPLFAVIGGIILITTIGPFLLVRGKTGSLALGTPRNYGVFGGAICPRCERPFARHIWGMNVVVGKLDRCPHCGKWSIVRAQPLSVLRAAEQAELDNADTEGRPNAMSEEERLRKELENSRYQDL
jgi:hypothetical protein